MLDPRHVFEQVEASKKNVNIFHKNSTIGKKKKLRSRDGYSASSTAVGVNQLSVANFIESNEDPTQLLSDYHVLIFDSRSQVYKQHKETTEEIELCCSDLLVLGKSDFRLLLK